MDKWISHQADPAIDRPEAIRRFVELGAEGQKMSAEKLQALQNTLAEMLSEPPLLSTNTEPSPPSFFDEEPAEQTPADASADAGNLAMRERAKSLLAGLELDTAIRLRWSLRGIKAKRTTFTPVSPSDLRTLIELGLVEMRDDLPTLTNEGHQALDQ